MIDDRPGSRRQRRRGLHLDEDLALEAATRGAASVGDGDAGSACVEDVERLFGRKLGAAQRALALLRCEGGDSAASTADWLRRQAAARLTLNDPLERQHDGTDLRRPPGSH